MPERSITFAERLRAHRESKGLSQYALAKLSGLSKQALSNLEAGRREPNWDTVQRVAAALGLDCTSFADPAVAASVPMEPLGMPGRPRKDASTAATPSTPPADVLEATASGSAADREVKARKPAKRRKAKGE